MASSRIDHWGVFFLRLCVDLGVILFHAILLVHASAVALVFINATEPRRYDCVRMHRQDCVWLFGAKLDRV
jgi:hypothetical protein